MTDTGTVPVTQIIRGSLVDGPGIRTVIFFKGCPLRCPWCHNPETQTPEPEVLYDVRQCIRCGACSEACRHSAINLSLPYIVNKQRCTACLSCCGTCPTAALKSAGRPCTAGELLDEVMKDTPYHKTSGGGVTLSGGEPLLYPRFVHHFLSQCKTNGIGTCIDTCLAVPRGHVGRVIDAADLFLVDIKHGSSREVCSDLVFANLALLAGTARVRIRIPVIPGWNNQRETMEEILERLLPFRNGIECVTLLPFHNTAAIKYRYLDRDWTFATEACITDEHIAELEVTFATAGFQVGVDD